MKCPACAEEVTEAGPRCPQCGEALRGPPGGAPPKGKGMSGGMIAALVLGGCLFMGVPVIAIIAAIAIPNLIEARKHGNEAAAIGAMKTLVMAEVLFREGDKDNDGKLQYGSLAQLGATTLIDPILASGVKQGYRFTIVVSAQAPELRWIATATPVAPGTTGDRFFMVDQDGFVYWSPTTAFTLDPDAGPPAGAMRLGR